MPNDKTIDQVLNDPDFMSLPEEDQNSFIDEMRQRDYGKPPAAESFLQNVIRKSRGPLELPLTGVGMLPSSTQEATDIGRVGARNFTESSGIGASGLVNYGAGLTEQPGGIREFRNKLSNESISKTLTPKTQYGKNLDVAVKAAPWASLGLEGATVGANKLFSSSELKSKIGNLNSTLDDIHNQGLDLAYNAPKEMKGKVIGRFNQARESYHDILQNHPAEIPEADLKNVVTKTIDGLKIRGRPTEYLDPAEKSLLNAESRFSEPEPSGTKITQSSILDSSGNPIYSSTEIPAEKPIEITDLRDIKNFKNSLFQSLRSNKGAQGEFLKNYGDMLVENGFSDLAETNLKYAKAYENSKLVKVFTQGRLGRIATGKDIASAEVSAMKSTESKMGLGTGNIQQAENLRAQKGATQKGLEESGNKLKKVMARQAALKNVGKYIARGSEFGAGAGLIYELGRSIFHKD